jgi:SAM-dependent methyltransferase
MKNVEAWRPSKAELKHGHWRGSRDRRELSIGSRGIADTQIPAYEKVLRNFARGVLADIGCGKMPYYGIYHDLVTQVLAIDWPNSEHENRHADILCDLNKEIPLPPVSVDTVVCTDVMEHIHNPQNLWNEIARILKPSGTAVISTPFLYWIHEVPHDYHRYTNFSLSRYAQEAGLTIVSLEAVGGLPHILMDLLCKMTQGVPPIAETIRLATVGALSIPAVSRLAQKSAKRFPQSYLLVVSKPS